MMIINGLEKNKPQNIGLTHSGLLAYLDRSGILINGGRVPETMLFMACNQAHAIKLESVSAVGWKFCQWGPFDLT